MFSNRVFPRGGKCNPHNNAVLYFTGSNGGEVGSQRYAGIWSKGVATVGYFGKKLPKGTYTLWVINQNGSSKPADITLHFYSSSTGVKVYNA